MISYQRRKATNSLLNRPQILGAWLNFSIYRDRKKISKNAYYMRVYIQSWLQKPEFSKRSAIVILVRIYSYIAYRLSHSYLGWCALPIIINIFGVVRSSRPYVHEYIENTWRYIHMCLKNVPTHISFVHIFSKKLDWQVFVTRIENNTEVRVYYMYTYIVKPTKPNQTVDTLPTRSAELW